MPVPFPSIHAQFVAMVVTLYKFCEKRKDTHNISGLLEHVGANKAIAATELKTLRLRHLELKPLWVKVGILRNKVSGHSSKARTSVRAFREARINGNDILDLLEGTKIISQ